MAAILPLAETVVLGGVDGALRAADIKAKRTTTFRQWSTYYEAALVALGAIGAMQRIHPDYWEPAVVGGLFALSQRGGSAVAAGAGIGGPGYGAFAANGGAFAGMGAPAALPMPGAFASQRVQPAGLLG